MKKWFGILALLLLTVTLCSCSFLQSDEPRTGTTKTITVHYYDNVTRIYELTAGRKTQCDFLTPKGQYITGLYSEDGVQYADEFLIFQKWNNSMPDHLYARYDDVKNSRFVFDQNILLDEDPKLISFYKVQRLSWRLKDSDSPDREFMLACLNNPYADVSITVEFYGKGSSGRYDNHFLGTLSIKDDELDKLDKEDLGSNYTRYTLNATVKARQLINADFEIKTLASSKYGEENYTVKNFLITMEIDFE